MTVTLKGPSMQPVFGLSDDSIFTNCIKMTLPKDVLFSDKISQVGMHIMLYVIN